MAGVPQEEARTGSPLDGRWCGPPISRCGLGWPGVVRMRRVSSRILASCVEGGVISGCCG